MSKEIKPVNFMYMFFRTFIEMMDILNQKYERVVIEPKRICKHGTFFNPKQQSDCQKCKDEKRQ